MNGNIYRSIENKKRKLTSIEQLNNYIESYERNFGEIKIKNVSINWHEKILRASKNLQSAIEKDKISKEQGALIISEYYFKYYKFI